jgi:CheY-like chemotaxis protein/glycine cleavage system H lipoate-binding protein
MAEDGKKQPTEERRTAMKATKRWRSSGSSNPVSASLKSRILVAEDEEDTLLGLQRTLTKQGYRVDIAKDGFEAIKKVETVPYDVIVSDLKMPRVDGMELLHVVKERDKDTIFIVITGYGTVNGAVEAIKEGASDYINKPFSPSTLIKAIEKALRGEDKGVSAQTSELIEKSKIRRHPSERIWYSLQDDGTVLVGADKEFYEEIGEIVYCDLPFECDKVERGETCIRMVNAREHMPKKLRSPVSGTVIKVNEKMLTQPWLAQKDPYGEGWLFVVSPSRLKEEEKIDSLQG